MKLFLVCARLSASLLVGLLASTLAARAAVVTYADNKAGFVAAVGGAPLLLPQSSGDQTVGNVQFRSAQPAQTQMIFGPGSNEISGNHLRMAGPDNFNLFFPIPSDTYALGFDLHEPNFFGNTQSFGCGVNPCQDTDFTIEARVFDAVLGTRLVGLFNYNAPDDNNIAAGGAVGFFGFVSTEPFDRVFIRQEFRFGTTDNQYFGNFYVRNTPVDAPPTPPSATPEPASTVLVLAALAALVLTRCSAASGVDS